MNNDGGMYVHLFLHGCPCYDMHVAVRGKSYMSLCTFCLVWDNVFVIHHCVWQNGLQLPGILLSSLPVFLHEFWNINKCHHARHCVGSEIQIQVFTRVQQTICLWNHFKMNKIALRDYGGWTVAFWHCPSLSSPN